MLNKILTRTLRVLVVLPAILFLITGLSWITNPANAASSLGMILLDGMGRSSQIGDVGALFFTMGIMILIAVVTARRSWFQAPAMMLACVAIFRIVAWLFHGATFAASMIMVEVVVAVLLLVASTKLSEKE